MIKSIIARLTFCLSTVLLMLALAGPAVAQGKSRLVVYSTLEVEHIGKLREAFEADNPDIELAIVRDATGVITARLLAEKNNPRGDAIWGLAVTSMMLLDREGVLLPYAPKGLAALRPNFRDSKDPPSWIGIDAWVGALCFNTIEADKLHLPRPASWFDLLDPAFKGRIVMPNPASSGTGYFHVAAWIQMFGEDAAWRFMDRLHENIAVYQHSGAAPCRTAATGEYAVGIAYELAGADAKQKGGPIDVLLMKEGAGWDMDTAGIVRGTANPALAQRLMDWAASRKANELYSQFLSQVAIDGISSPRPFYPEGVAASMIKNDFAWAAANRARILAEWQRRYEGKSAKR